MYHVVSDKKKCKHTDGGSPYGCKSSVARNCENDCTKFDECIGFSQGKYCYLYPSSKSCPAGWMTASGSIARTPDSLTVAGSSWSPNYNCKTKKGMISHKVCLGLIPIIYIHLLV